MEHGTGSRTHCCPRCGAKMESEETHTCGSATEKPDATHRKGGHSAPERIRKRAYEIYVTRGREDGHATEDWSQAEKELSNAATAGKCD